MRKDSNIVVIASAGTGKTYRLVSEFISTMLGDGQDQAPVHPRNILALTFTDKAAAEMRTRIRDRLIDLEVQQSSSMQKRIRDLDQSIITTYHSFCAKIIRDYADEVQIDSQFRLLESFEERQIGRKIAKKVIIDRLEKKEKDFLSLVGRLGLGAARENSGLIGYLLRIKEQLAENGLDVSSIKSAHEMGLVDYLSSRGLDGLLKEIGQVLESYKQTKLSATAKQRVSQVSNSFEALKAVFISKPDASFEMRVSHIFSVLKQQVSGRFGPDDMRKNLVSKISQIGSALCSSLLFEEQKAFKSLLADFIVELEQEKKNRLCLGFSDLLVITRRLLRENLKVRKEVKSQFTRVLVDEYQDTSPIQEEIVSLLCESSQNEKELLANVDALTNIELEKGKLFVVGDPKQSIYGFRGSDVSLFQKMVNKIRREGGASESLNVSRRSSSSVVQIINKAVDCPQEEKLSSLESDDLKTGGGNYPAKMRHARSRVK